MTAGRPAHRGTQFVRQAGFPLTNEDGCWRLLETSESSWAIPVNPTEVVVLMLTEDLLAPVEGSWLAEPLANLRSRLSFTCVFRDSAFADDVAKTNLTAILEKYRDDEGHPRIARIRSL